MTILNKLKEVNNIVGSECGKKFAEEVLNGNIEILKEAEHLIKHEDKNIRAGAAKIIEKVAEVKPELIHLEKILPGLDMPEPQTRWMITHAIGLCAKCNTDFAYQAFDKIQKFLTDRNSGACLWDRSICYMKYIGLTSSKRAQKVLPILEQALINIPSQTKTILESFEKLILIADRNSKIKILNIAQKYQNNEKNSIKNKAISLIKKLSL